MKERVRHAKHDRPRCTVIGFHVAPPASKRRKHEDRDERSGTAGHSVDPFDARLLLTTGALVGVEHVGVVGFG